MQTPTRALYALRPTASPGIVAAAAAVSTLFAATPFALGEIANRYGVSLGIAGIMSTLQVGGFAAASFLAGRLLSPSRRLLVIAAILGVVANAAGIVTAAFPLLLVERTVAGVAAGVITWIAWTDAMTDRSHLQDIAAAGPLTAVIASPVFGLATSIGDDRLIFALIAAAFVPALALPASLPEGAGPVRARSASRSNRVLLVALGLLTMAGSSLFVYAAAFGRRELGMAAVVVSLAYSLNSAAGIVGTRLKARPRTGGLWMAATAAAAGTLVVIAHPVWFYAAMALWGVAFWLAIPDVFRSLAERSLTPAERTGDAQAAMAVGRALGPLAGGIVLAGAGFTALGLVAAAGMLAAALLVSSVDRYRSAEVAPAAA